MTTSIFINALGQAIFESCGQALLVYVVLQLAMQLFPSISSKYRYDINYLGLTIVTLWFLANLIKIYLHNASMSKFNLLIYGGQTATSAKNLPTLFQQAEAFIAAYAKYITGLYLIGLMLHAFKLIGGFVHIHHIRRQRNLSADNTWTAKAVQLCKQLKIVKTVGLFFSSQVDIPLTIGYFKPIIIFPIALINNLETEQVEAILLHELAHIKRHDYLLNILQCVMETLLCFNPFVWLLSKTIRREREYCCDDMVMEEEYNNFSYSKALFIIAQQNSRNYALAMGSADQNKYPLLNRIKRLNNMKTNDSLPKFHLLIIVAVAAIGGLLAWGIPQYSHATAIHRVNHKLTKPSLQVAPLSPVAPPIPQPISPATKMSVKFYADTSGDKATRDSIVSHSKAKFKIVMEDDKGNKKEYNSVQELPDSEKNEFLKENPSFGDHHKSDFEGLADFEVSPEWRKQALEMNASVEKMAMELKKNNPQWKAQALAMKLQAEKLNKQFNSPEWKKQIEDMKLDAEKMKDEANSPEWKKQVEDMKRQAEKIKEQFNSPEWKKQMADIKKQNESIRKHFNSTEWKMQMADIKTQNEAIRKKFSSPEWKAQMDAIRKQSNEINKQFDSPEVRKQMQDLSDKIQKEVNDNLTKAFTDSVKVGN